MAEAATSLTGGHRADLAPSGRFAEHYAKSRLANDFMHKGRVCRMKPATACIAEQTFKLIASEHAATSRDIHRGIDDSPAGFNRMVFGENDARGRCRSMFDACGPVLRHTFQVRENRIKGERHLRDRVLDFRVIRHRSADRDGGLAAHSGDRDVDDSLRDPGIYVGPAPATERRRVRRRERFWRRTGQLIATTSGS